MTVLDQFLIIDNINSQTSPKMDESSISDNINPHKHSVAYKKTKRSTLKRKSSKKSKKDDEDFQVKTDEWNRSKKADSYYWNEIQNKRYVKFLKEYGELLRLSAYQRKIKKVNLEMSKKIKTRSSTQCHTHHQKMIARHGTIEDIISYYQKSFDKKGEAQFFNLASSIIEQRQPQRIQIIEQIPMNEATSKEIIVESFDLSFDQVLSMNQFCFERFEPNEFQLLEWMNIDY